MRLTFVLGVAVTLACVFIGDVAPSIGEESDGDFLADPLDGANRKRVATPEVGLDAGAIEATVDKRGPAISEGSWVKAIHPSRRGFSPWGGKRYFNPWGGKRFKGIQLERKANAILDKRPGFQPWGGKRDVPVPTEEEKLGCASSEKRAFSPWGGKRESPSRDQSERLFLRQALNGFKSPVFVKP